MFLALIPNRSSNTFGGPDRGMSVTASFLTVMSLSSATADNTASPKPPKQEEYKIYFYDNKYSIKLKFYLLRNDLQQ